MASILDTVDQRTQLAGENRLELLLFELTDSKQWYGINVFKVREILKDISLTILPGSHYVVCGVTHIRGITIPIYDLSSAIGFKSVSNPEDSIVVITEYNQLTQGFLVNNVIKIVNTNWEAIRPPPGGTGANCFLTAVTEVDKHLVEIIDVEKVLQEVCPNFGELSDEQKEHANSIVQDKVTRVLACDDSSVARKQVQNTLEQMGVECDMYKNGREALERLLELTSDGSTASDHYALLISDIEMPEMDGYKLTTEIRSRNQLRDLYVVLHTSLSGVFNNALIKKVGADKFIPKFQPEIIAGTVLSCIEQDE